jgi:2-aminoethylphosphonate transport system permease protein
VLVWSRTGRAAIWSLTGVLIGIAYAAPLALVVLASFAGQWNDVLPRALTLAHYRDAFGGSSFNEVRASLLTAALSSIAALVIGTWAALALRDIAPAPRRILDLVFFVPSAVPSVSVGLGLLVAFSQPPLLLNGTIAIVCIAHLVLVSAFAYGNVSAGLARLAPEYEAMAASLGARPFYCLRRVTLPLLMPYLIAAFSPVSYTH